MLVWAAGARRPEVEEALRPLDGHRTVTRARIVHILTKLTKPSVPINLVGPQVILPLYWVQLTGGVFIFLCVIRRHFLACEDVIGGSDLSAEGMFFHEIQRPFRRVPDVWWRNHYLRVIRRHFLVCGRGPNCQPLHVQSTSDACRSLTTLTMPR